MSYGGRKKTRLHREKQPELEATKANSLEPSVVKGFYANGQQVPRTQRRAQPKLTALHLEQLRQSQPGRDAARPQPQAPSNPKPIAKPIPTAAMLETTPQMRFEEKKRLESEAKGLILQGSKWVVPPQRSAAFQRYAEINGLESPTTAINPASLSTKPLEFAMQAKLESVLGPLPRIQIAAQSDADAQSQAINARAFTSGVTIAFRAGRYDPESLEGFKLLLHEATHVKQQALGLAPSGIDTDPGLEREAQSQADAINAIPQLELLDEKAPAAAHIASYSGQLKQHHRDLGPDKSRFEALRDLFWQVPPEYQARSRFNLLSQFKDGTFENQQLNEHLVSFAHGGLELKASLEAQREREQAVKRTRAATTFQTEVPRANQNEFKPFNLEQPQKPGLPSDLRENVVNQYQHQFEQSSFTPQWKTLTNAVWGESNSNSSIEQSAIPRMDHNVFSSGNITKASPKNQEFTATPITSNSLPIKNTNSSRQRVQRATNYNIQSNTVQRSSQIIQRWSVMEEASNFVAGVIPGYKTLCSALGKDLITGNKVDQNPNAIMDALSDLVPGPIKDMVKALKESNAIPKAWAWFKGELSKVNLAATWKQVKDAIGDAGVFNLGETKDKVMKAIMTPVNQVKTLVGGSIRKLAEIALEAIGAMAGGSGKQLIDGLKGAGDVIMEVIKNPGKFIGNLIKSLSGGVKNFAANAKTHLSKGLGSWLSGESGMAFPANLDVKGVFTLALTVLGVTYQNFRKSLVKKLGEDKTKIAEDKVDMVKNLASKGMHAAEGMQAEQGTVKTEVIEGAKDFVKQSVIQAAVEKLISMFIPGGGLVQLFLTGFKMVQFVVQEGSRIAALASSIIGGVANIAQGNITGAVAKVESSLAQAIPLALSFLSKIFRVSGIGTKIKNIIQKVKGKIDAVTKKVMDKVAAAVAKVVGTMATGANKVKDATVNGVKKLINGVFGKKSFRAGKEQHSVWVKVKNNEPELWIASTPREATAQINALENEAKTKNILPLVTNSINLARDKIKNAQGALRKKVATGQVDDTEMSRHATEAVNGVEFSVKDVFDQIEKHGAGATLKLNLNFSQLKHEFWSNGGRPAFSTATKNALGTLSADEDRRHTQAFDDIFKNTIAQVNGKTYAEAQTWLSGKSFAPASADLQIIKDKLKSYMHKEFNRLENLWVGEKRENQTKGSNFGAAERGLKNLTPGTPEYEAALARRSGAVVDPAKGTATGKKIGTVEQAWISQISGANNRLPNIHQTHEKGNLKQGNPFHTLALNDRTQTQVSQRSLGDFSKHMNISEFGTINNALQTAAKVIYELNRMLSN